MHQSAEAPNGTIIMLDGSMTAEVAAVMVSRAEVTWAVVREGGLVAGSVTLNQLAACDDGTTVSELLHGGATAAQRVA